MRERKDIGLSANAALPMYAFGGSGERWEGRVGRGKDIPEEVLVGWPRVRSNMRRCEFMCVCMCVLAPLRIRPHADLQWGQESVWVCVNFVYVCVDPKQGCLYKSCFLYKNIWWIYHQVFYQRELEKYAKVRNERGVRHKCTWHDIHAHVHSRKVKLS